MSGETPQASANSAGEKCLSVTDVNEVKASYALNKELRTNLGKMEVAVGLELAAPHPPKKRLAIAKLIYILAIISPSFISREAICVLEALNG